MIQKMRVNFHVTCVNLAELFCEITVKTFVFSLEVSENGNHPLSSWQLDELYYLWQLAGGDVHTELKRNGLIKNKPPILSMPR